MSFAMPHMIVVIPGIMGSRLVDREGTEIWGVSAGTILRSITRLGRNFDKIRLPVGVGDANPDDGVVATSLLTVPHMISRLFGADGYEALIVRLKKDFELVEPSAERAGNLVRFPYDWRLSNRYNGKVIESELVPQLERWRKQSGNADAKFIFICHSMGGLVARWFIEMLGGRELTRRLITIGTPYRGSLQAVHKLSNGFDPGFGPLRIPLTKIVRSLPSTYQLLPTYKCIESHAGMQRLDEFAVPGLDTAMIADALEFHHQIDRAARSGTTQGYRVLALKGTEQPTAQSAKMGGGAIELINSYNGKDFKGDGTVPRQSSHPPEWESDDVAGAFGQQHAMLQSDTDLHRQLRSIISADEMEVHTATENMIALDLPEVSTAGSTLHLDVESAQGNAALPLRARLLDEHGAQIGSRLMRNHGGGAYRASFDEVPSGLIKVEVASAAPFFPMTPVTGMTLVCDEAGFET